MMLHQGTGMHHKFNFFMTRVENLQLFPREANYPAPKCRRGLRGLKMEFVSYSFFM